MKGISHIHQFSAAHHLSGSRLSGSLWPELSDITVKISKNYEAYLGKEVLSVSVIESLIDIINDGGAETVGDALEQYKKTVDKSIQPI